MKSALAASIAARGLAAVLGLLALPVYLRFLGVEAYGVVGLFASLQVVVAFMDFGLPTTLTRELATLAREPAGIARARDLTRTFELAYVVLAILIAAVLAAAAPFVASHWVNADTLSTSQIAWPLQLAALSLACGWPANLYTAGLAGLHRQVPLAASSSAFAVVRVGLAILFLWWRPTLESFFTAQLLASLMQSFGMRLQLWHALRMEGHRARASAALLAQSRRFAGGMTMITIGSILLSQMDKLILSHLLPLSEFGLYSIAAALAAGLYVLVSPVFSVVYPRISAVWSAGDTAQAASLYHASAQFMAWLVMPVAAVLACFPQQALFVLTDHRYVSEQAAPMLVLLVAAAACNGIMNIPYALQLAAGWTSLSVWLNAAAVVLMAPATWWAATRHGAVGGAAAWAILNLGYVFLTPQLLHRRLLPREKWQWYVLDILAPAAVSLGVAWLLATMGPAAPESRLTGLLGLALCWALTAAATLACLGRLRPLVAALIVRKTHA